MRFKADDGSDFPRWEEKKLGDLCSYVHKRGQAGNYVGTENLLQNFGGIRQLGADQKKEGILYSKGDILFSNIRPYLKKTWLADRSGTCSSDVLVFRSTTVLPGYLYSLIASDRFIGEVMGSAKGSKMPRGDKQAILQIASAVPSLPEQNKIASLLSSIDSTLTLCQRKLDLLTQAKKALMQQIFSQKLRFKADDGSEFPAWEEKKLGDLYTVNNERNKEGRFKKSQTLSVATMQQKPSGNGDSVESVAISKVLRIGDVLFEGHMSKAHPLGRLIVNTNQDGIVSPRFRTFRPQHRMNANFWKYFFVGSHETNRLLLRSTKAGIMMNEIVDSDFFHEKVCVPTCDEQQKIASCLSSADALIDQARAELEQWQEVKKSLLQQLFV